MYLEFTLPKFSQSIQQSPSAHQVQTSPNSLGVLYLSFVHVIFLRLLLAIFSSNLLARVSLSIRTLFCLSFIVSALVNVHVSLTYMQQILT